MADPKKISPQTSKKELDKWLQQQLNAAGSDASPGQDGLSDEDDPFYTDAMEGLNKFGSTREIYQQASRVNRSIQKKTGAGRKKGPFEAGHMFWFVVAIIVIIMVIILAFVVIRMRLGQI